jgi:hypothetical protein
LLVILVIIPIYTEFLQQIAIIGGVGITILRHYFFNYYSFD